jgi:hypothetical protein
MARKTTIILTDDIDGSKADTTVGFALDGVEYEIDLTDEHADALRETLQYWIAPATRIGGRAKRGTAATANTSDAKLVRAWAKENGIEVPDRGRVPASVRDRYYEANSVAA